MLAKLSFRYVIIELFKSTKSLSCILHSRRIFLCYYMYIWLSYLKGLISKYILKYNLHKFFNIGLNLQTTRCTSTIQGACSVHTLKYFQSLTIKSSKTPRGVGHVIGAKLDLTHCISSSIASDRVPEWTSCQVLIDRLSAEREWD